MTPHKDNPKMKTDRHSKQHHNDHPGTFTCPLTYKVMEDPVMDRCAHNFERAAIMEWIEKGNNFCPISRKDLTPEDLVPNHKLAEQIERWTWKKDTEPKLRHLDEEMSNSERSCERLTESGIESDIYEDEETGHAPPKKSFLRSYDDVPTEMMLLPQERRLLEHVHAQEELEAHKRRRRCLLRCVAAVVFIVGFSAAGLILWIRLRPENEIQGQP